MSKKVEGGTEDSVRESTEYENLIGVKEGPSLFPTLGGFIGEDNGTGEDIDTQSWMANWKAAPEYHMEKKETFKDMIIKFRNEDDFNEFLEKLDLKHLSVKTKSTYYPYRAPRDLTVLRWMGEDEINED